jgi:hypothetical protein
MALGRAAVSGTIEISKFRGGEPTIVTVGLSRRFGDLLAVDNVYLEIP